MHTARVESLIWRTPSTQLVLRQHFQQDWGSCPHIRAGLQMLAPSPCLGGHLWLVCLVPMSLSGHFTLTLLSVPPPTLTGLKPHRPLTDWTNVPHGDWNPWIELHLKLASLQTSQTPEPINRFFEPLFPFWLKIRCCAASQLCDLGPVLFF